MMISRSMILGWFWILALPGMFVTGCEKKVFVTAGLYTGALGGLAGADAKCQAEAQAAGLSGSYKAWLSDFYQGPYTRFSQYNAPYLLVDRTVVARNWVDLTDATIRAPIELTQFGAVQEADPYRRVWSNTMEDGRPLSDDIRRTCAQWTTDDPTLHGNTGNSDQVDSRWTFDQVELGACDEQLPLYCFEQ